MSYEIELFCIIFYIRFKVPRSCCDKCRRKGLDFPRCVTEPPATCFTQFLRPRFISGNVFTIISVYLFRKFEKANLSVDSRGTGTFVSAAFPRQDGFSSVNGIPRKMTRDYRFIFGGSSSVSRRSERNFGENIGRPCKNIINMARYL